ncbi:hypothetical protein KXV45_008194 [Aspergillus fumigatus]|nr:hypothetical protein KXV45_008194 [Aspergillus fumigatus]KAH2276595.1 hypothetical protein KXW02_008513 [Aspergillus fumigatus]
MRASFLLPVAIYVLTAYADDKTTTVGYFIPSWSVTLLSYGVWTSTGASVAGINAAATTYHLGCLKDAPKTDCNIKNSWTIIQGPETVSATGVYTASTSGKETSYDITVTESYECKIRSRTESASCTMSVGMTGSVGGAAITSSTSTSATYSPATSSYYELVVTAGVDKFTVPEATKTPGVAAAGPAGALITAGPVVAAAFGKSFRAEEKGSNRLNNGSGALVYKGAMESIVHTMLAPHIDQRSLDSKTMVAVKKRTAQHAKLAAFMNAGPDEIEIVVSGLCHEADVAAFAALAKTLGISISLGTLRPPLFPKRVLYAAGASSTSPDLLNGVSPTGLSDANTNG